LLGHCPGRSQGSPELKAQADSDDATGRSANGQVEVLANRLAEGLLELSQNVGCENIFDTATIYGQDTEPTRAG
jgi:hypothetical protein